MFFVPWILRYDTVGSATAPANWLGAIIIIISAIALAIPHAWEEWGNLVVGALLIIAPWVVGFGASHVPTVNDAILGIVIFLAALSGINLPMMAGRRQRNV